MEQMEKEIPSPIIAHKNQDYSLDISTAVST